MTEGKVGGIARDERGDVGVRWVEVGVLVDAVTTAEGVHVGRSY